MCGLIGGIAVLIREAVDVSDVDQVQLEAIRLTESHPSLSRPLSLSLSLNSISFSRHADVTHFTSLAFRQTVKLKLSPLTRTREKSGPY